MLGFLLGLVVGAIGGGFIVKNNKDKAFAALDTLKAAAEEEVKKLKASNKK